MNIIPPPDTAMPQASNLSKLIDVLSARFGEHASVSEAVLAQHGADESHHKNAPPDIVVFARSTQDVSVIVQESAKHRIPVIAFGAGTSLEGHVNAIHGGVCIDFSGMNEIVATYPEDLNCVVQAGVRRKQLNADLRDKGLFFPIDPGPDATIGGMAATRASGTNAVRYGTMAENVVALTVVLADGQVIRTKRRSKKSSAGYDLTRLFVGSEGTLGIITEVTLRLYGLPESTIVARTTYVNLSDAVDTVVEAIQLGLPLARAELLDDRQIAAINEYSSTDFPIAHTLFFELHGSESSTREQLETLAEVAESNRSGAFEFAEKQEDKTALWQARHDAYYAAIRQRQGAAGWATDVCVPISRLAECINETRKDLEGISVPACIVGHVGDGNFHVVFSVFRDSEAEMGELKAFSKRLSLRAIEMDGTCTGEHGVGLGKIDSLPAEHGPALELMRLLKRTMDPMNILNPGKLIDASR